VSLAALGGLPIAAEDRPIIRETTATQSNLTVVVALSTNSTRATIETNDRLGQARGDPRRCTGLLAGQGPGSIRAWPGTQSGSSLRRCAASADNSYSALRLRVLHNGYFLTVDPGKALAPDSTADRYRCMCCMRCSLIPVRAKSPRFIPIRHGFSR